MKVIGDVMMELKALNAQNENIFFCFLFSRTKNLFDKFEHFLEYNQFFSRIQSVSCQKHDVKVELFLCEDGTSGKAFQFVYFNKLSEHDGKWTKFINKLCKKKFEKVSSF